eukprot:COSAG04_NODE_8434_length_976_cov_1.007982_1_plen_119_part_10
MSEHGARLQKAPIQKIPDWCFVIHSAAAGSSQAAAGVGALLAAAAAYRCCQMANRPRRSLAVALVGALAAWGPPSASERPGRGQTAPAAVGTTLRFSPPVLLGSGVEVTLQNGSEITLH